MSRKKPDPMMGGLDEGKQIMICLVQKDPNWRDFSAEAHAKSNWKNLDLFIN